jgi:hypothetical protein
VQNSPTPADDLTDDDRAASDKLLQQTNKRITLNLLIQGAAVHASLTSHHLVRDELEAIRPGLTNFYDRVAASLILNYFIGDVPLLFGLPSRFWGRTQRPSHLYHEHRLLATYGRELWQASKRYLIARGWKKWIICIPVLHHIQMLWLVARTAWLERGKRARLARLAERANSLIWDINANRTEAQLTMDVAFGHLQEPKTFVGRMIRAGVIGYGGVERRNGRFKVVAKAWNFPLVSHELAKGTAELVCLHGLNSLDERTYKQVTEEADQIEYETWMIQAGSEMWRRLLTAVPNNKSLPETLMHLARLDPAPLEQLMMSVVEDPAQARAWLEEL